MGALSLELAGPGFAKDFKGIDKSLPYFQLDPSVDRRRHRLVHIVRSLRQRPCPLGDHHLLPHVEPLHRPPSRLSLQRFDVRVVQSEI